MNRPRIYLPKNHRRRAPLAAAIEDALFDARQVPIWLRLAALAGVVAAGMALRSCAARHSLVAPEDRMGLRTYEAIP